MSLKKPAILCPNLFLPARNASAEDNGIPDPELFGLDPDFRAWNTYLWIQHFFKKGAKVV